jgi:type II secretory pathway component PulF
MTTLSRNRADAHAVWVGVAKGVGILAGIAIVGGLVFFCCFILPKIEAKMYDAGVSPSPPLRLLIFTTFYVIKYFWLILIAGLVLVFVSARNASSRRSEMPRD